MASPLDDVQGIGPGRKKALLKRFGSLARLSRASLEEIAATPGVGSEIARAVYERLHGSAPAPERRASA
jgi:excinuclease ABC subunit C